MSLKSETFIDELKSYLEESDPQAAVRIIRRRDLIISNPIG
jgi:hypothetical protein